MNVVFAFPLKFVNLAKRLPQTSENDTVENLRFGRATKQEAKRFSSTNADNLTSFFAAIEKIISENDIDAECLCNLDECGISSEIDKVGRCHQKVYSLRSSKPQQKLPEFHNVDRITMMPVIFASGQCGKPLFVIKGKRLPYQYVEGSIGRERIETLADCLLRGSIITSRSETASVDKEKFLRWAKQFVKDIQDLTSNGRKVLLLYDAYRSHMHIQALRVLDEGGVIAFALLAHISGTLQPLDVGVFGPWKAHIDKVLYSMCSPGAKNIFDLFDFCKITKAAYCSGFTRSNIQSGFRMTGLWPLDPTAILGQNRPLLSECQTVATIEEMERMLEEKRVMLRSKAGLNPIVLKRGFIDTSAGVNLTSKDAMDLVSKKEDAERRRFLEARKKKASADLNEARRAASVRSARLEHEAKAIEYRVVAYGDCGVSPRPMSVRRKIAAEQAVAKKALASFNSATLTPRVKRHLDPCNQLQVRELDRIV